MLHFHHQLVSNWIGLLFAAGQVVYCGFTRACQLKTGADAAGNSPYESAELNAKPYSKCA